jgi:hypothetical protein
VSRHEAPGLVPPFLEVLRCVARAAGAEAADLAAAWAAVDAEVRAAAAAEGVGAGDARSGSSSASDGNSENTGAAATEAAPAGAAEVRAYFLARAARRAAREARPPGVPLPAVDEASEGIVEEGDGDGSGADGDGGGDAVRKLLLPAAQLEALDALWRRAHAAAALAGAAADAAAPLLLQRGLRAAALAHEVAGAAADALAASTTAVDTEAALFESVLSRGPGAALRPVRPETPKLLPAVAALWGPLLAALRTSPSVPLLEVGLRLLARLTVLAGGQFMTRRVQKEALPLLLRLLREGAAPAAAAALLEAAAAPLGAWGGPGSHAGAAGGGGGSSEGDGLLPLRPAAPARSAALLGLEAGGSSTAAAADPSGPSGSGGNGGGILARAAQLMAAPGTGGGASGGDSELSPGAAAPASLARVRAAVLGCLEAIAADDAARPALAGAAWRAAAAAAPLLSDAQPLNVREAAARALVALARADADAVWLLLLDLAASGPDGAPPGAAGAADPPAGLPPLRALLPPPRPAPCAGRGRGGGGGGPAPAGAVTPELAQAAGRRAGALLERLCAPGGACAAGGAAWHARVARQLEVFDERPLS